MVQLSVGDNYTLPVATAIDDVDGNISNNININNSEIASFYDAATEKYIFTTSGLYYVIYSVSDAAGNEATLTLQIEVSDLPTYTGYYASINGKTGAALISALYTLLNDMGGKPVTTTYGQARYYLGESDVWTGFNTNYLYLIYTDTLRTPAADGFQVDGYALPTWDANNDGCNSTWNREHVWAKSLFGTGNYNPSDTTVGIDADLHNLRACDTNVNSTRGNNKFINTLTQSGGFGNYNSMWYPGDDHRGDVARILFYMDIRWGNDTNLSLIGDLPTLKQWHETDPVDEFEIHRNQVIYEKQGNRNPFIDHPELIDLIWEQMLEQAGVQANATATFIHTIDTYIVLRTAYVPINNRYTIQ